MSAHRSIVLVTPWKRRWEMGDGAGLADDKYFIDGFAAHGYDVHFVSPRDRNPPDISTPGYHVHGFYNFYDSSARWPTPLKRLIWPLLFTLLASWQTWRVGRRVRPMVVLGHSYVASAAAFIAARALRVPSVVKLFGVMDLARTELSTGQRWRRHGEMLAALRFPHAAWIVLDDGTRGAEALAHHGVPADRIHFLPNGVNLEWADRGNAAWLRGRLGIDTETPIVLYIARLVGWKRPDVFVRVAARVHARFAAAAFVIAGDGPERARCEALVRSLGVGEAVHFAGPVPHAHIPDVMASASMLVATSQHSNRSIAACEALVCGVPVVAFDTGETGAVVRDGETGRLVRDEDEAALADAIVGLLEDGDARRTLATGARNFAKSNFVSWSQRVERERDILERVARRG